MDIIYQPNAAAAAAVYSTRLHISVSVARLSSCAELSVSRRRRPFVPPARTLCRTFPLTCKF